MGACLVNSALPPVLWYVASRMPLGSVLPRFWLECVCGPQPPFGIYTLVKTARMYIRQAASTELISLWLEALRLACRHRARSISTFDTGAPREDHRLVGLWVGGLFKEVRQRASNTIERRSCLMKGERSLLRHVPDSSSPRGRRRQTSII